MSYSNILSGEGAATGRGEGEEADREGEEGKGKATEEGREAGGESGEEEKVAGGGHGKSRDDDVLERMTRMKLRWNRKKREGTEGELKDG